MEEFQDLWANAKLSARSRVYDLGAIMFASPPGFRHLIEGTMGVIIPSKGSSLR